MKTEELIENYLVYTDNGIEKVHWCNVNGVKELVSPKGKVYGYVPDYFQNKHLQEQLKEAVDFIEELSEACDLEGILYPEHREKLEEIEKWDVK